MLFRTTSVTLFPPEIPPSYGKPELPSIKLSSIVSRLPLWA